MNTHAPAEIDAAVETPRPSRRERLRRPAGAIDSSGMISVEPMSRSDGYVYTAGLYSDAELKRFTAFVHGVAPDRVVFRAGARIPLKGGIGKRIGYTIIHHGQDL